MSAEPQGFFKADYGYVNGYASDSGLPAAELAEKARTSAWHVSTLFEAFWSFYEAMRAGRPLPNADEKLHQMGNALRNLTRQDP